MIDFVLSYLPLLNLIILNCGLALSQYVVLRAGVFSVATAGLASIGAYTAGLLILRAGVPALVAVFGGALTGMIAALILSVPLARLRGVFQAIATVAMVQFHDRAAGPHHRADRPERRRQDHGRQSHYRLVEARRRQHNA
jgi:branched-chain amino acid transport system permease protein